MSDAYETAMNAASRYKWETMQRVIESVRERLAEEPDADTSDVLWEIVDDLDTVIYTGKACIYLAASNNDDAMKEETGEAGDASQRCYYAILADVREELDRAGWGNVLPVDDESLAGEG